MTSKTVERSELISLSPPPRGRERGGDQSLSRAGHRRRTAGGGQCADQSGLLPDLETTRVQAHRGAHRKSRAALDAAGHAGHQCLFAGRQGRHGAVFPALPRRHRADGAARRGRAPPPPPPPTRTAAMPTPAASERSRSKWTASWTALSIALSALMLTACAHSPAPSQAPPPPPNLAARCPDLDQPADSTGAAILRWAVGTVAQYRDCQQRHGALVDAWPK